MSGGPDNGITICGRLRETGEVAILQVEPHLEGKTTYLGTPSLVYLGHELADVTAILDNSLTGGAFLVWNYTNETLYELLLGGTLSKLFDSADYPALSGKRGMYIQPGTSKNNHFMYWFADQPCAGSHSNDFFGETVVYLIDLNSDGTIDITSPNSG